MSQATAAGARMCRGTFSVQADEVAEWQGYGIGLEKQYYVLRNAEDAALCVNITKYAEMMEH